MQREEGAFPDVRYHIAFVPCFHCTNPVCVTAAKGAMYKEEKYGAVLIDPDKANSSSLRDAWDACPYGAIAFDSDSPTATASKCTMCIDRLSQALMPVCVMSCPMRALDFGPIGDIQKKYGTNADLPGLPSSSIAKPAVVFKPMDPRKQIVPYNSSTALNLFMTRDNLPAGHPQGLPPLFTDVKEVTDLSTVVIGHSKWIMKPQSAKELMDSCIDEG